MNLKINELLDYPEIAANFLILLLKYGNYKKIEITTDQLVPILKYAKANKLIDESLIKEQIQNAYQQYNASVFQFFHLLYADLAKELNLNPARAEMLLSVTKQDYVKFHELMQQFTSGFGKTHYDGILLSCAQIADRKSYEFNPTVIYGEGEFRQYLTEIAKLPYPLRERFYIKDSHCLSGDIWRDEKGKVSVLLIDSFGINSSHRDDYSEILHQQFPGATIYVSNENKQRSDYGCSIFALDDLVHLYTIEKYLPDEYKHGPAPLHAYLAHSANELNITRTSYANVTEHACAMPLRMLLNMQTRKLTTDIIPNREEKEKNSPVNKKAESPEKAANKYFEGDESHKQNKRLEHKLARFAECNVKFMAKGNFQSKMHLFSLDNKKEEFESRVKKHLLDKDEVVEPSTMQQRFEI